MTEILSEADRKNELAQCLKNGWVLVDKRDAISKSYKFESFVDAFSWMTAVSLWAEKINHHPEWFNVYSRLKIRLTTHDVGGLSRLDFTMAERIDLLIAERTRAQ